MAVFGSGTIETPDRDNNRLTNIVLMHTVTPRAAVSNGGRTHINDILSYFVGLISESAK